MLTGDNTKTSRPEGRLSQLDALRGVLAAGVMVYHFGGPEALGTWGVYAFFVLSGWALEYVYGGRLELRSFFVARFARLAPLWIPIVLVSAWVNHLFDPLRLALNLTGLFGLVASGQTSIPTGGWSIGIEVACYLTFPFLTRLSTRWLGLTVLALLALRFWWVGGLMPDNLTTDWIRYTVPQSFLVFFAFGMFLSRTVTLPRMSPRAAALSTVLGDLSYGTYLMHPLLATISPVATIVGAPALALLVRRYWEVPLGRWIRRSARHASDPHERGHVVPGRARPARNGAGPGADVRPDRVGVRGV